MKRWLAVLVFAFFAIMEFGDLVGLLSGFSRPEPYASLAGISTGRELLRLVILSILSLGIAVSALATAIGLIRRKPYSRISAGLTAFFFISYGIYQIVSAIFQLTNHRIEVITAGIVYVLLGFVASWIGRKGDASFSSK